MPRVLVAFILSIFAAPIAKAETSVAAAEQFDQYLSCIGALVELNEMSEVFRDELGSGVSVALEGLSGAEDRGFIEPIEPTHQTLVSAIDQFLAMMANSCEGQRQSYLRRAADEATEKID